jgi:hypothetical protein
VAAGAQEGRRGGDAVLGTQEGQRGGGRRLALGTGEGRRRRSGGYLVNLWSIWIEPKEPNGF